MVNNQMAYSNNNINSNYPNVETLPHIKNNSSYFSVGQGCPPDDPERNVLKGANDRANNIGAIAKNLGLDEKCVQTATLHSNQFMHDTKTAAKVGFFAGASNASTITDNTLDTEMMQAGCGALALTANVMMNETANITCNINSTYSSQTQTVNAGATITLRTKPIATAVANEITASITKQQASINAMKFSTLADANNNIEAWERLLDRDERRIANAQAALNDFIRKNPTSSGLFGSNVQFTLKQSIKMSARQTVNEVNHTEIATSVKNIAEAAAFNQITQETGVNALTSDSRQLLQQKITDAVKDQTNNIKRQYTENKMSLTSSGDILIEISGAIYDSNIAANLSSQADLQVNQTISLATSIGKQVATEIISTITANQNIDNENAGMDDMTREQLEGQRDLLEQSGDNQNDFFKNFFDSMKFPDLFTWLWMLPMIIGIVVLLFFPQVANIIAPGPLKYVLAAVLLYFIVAWFIGFWPFGESENHSVQNYGPIQRLSRLAHISKDRKKPRTQKLIPYNYNYPVLQ